MARGGGADDAPSTLRALLGEIEKGWPAGLTVLTGRDAYHLDRAQRALVEALVPPESAGFGLTVYGDQKVDVSLVVASARSAGMFSARRVVLVRDLSALDGDPEPLALYAADPPPASHLIVRAPDLDRRRKLHQTLVKTGREIRFPEAGPGDGPRLTPHVVEMAAERGLQMARPAALLLVEIAGGDFYRIVTELDKIRAWLESDPRKQVTVEVLREVAAGSAALSGWEVAGALLRRDRAAAFEGLVRLLEAGEEPLRLLGGLSYRARAILQARAMVERGVPAGRALGAARIWGESPDAAARGLARYTMADVLRFPSLLLEADRTLKSRSLAPAAVLGSLLERMMPPPARGAEEPGR